MAEDWDDEWTPPMADRPALVLLPKWSGWDLAPAPGRVVVEPTPARRRAACRQPRPKPTPPWQREIAWPRPLAPTGLTAIAEDGQIRLWWSAVGGADTYVVKRATAPGGPYEVIADGVRKTRGTNQTVERGTVYYYVVSAVNQAGVSPDSSEVAVYLPTAAELVSALETAPPREKARARADRLARLELARMGLLRPWGGVAGKASGMFAKKRLSMGEIAIGKMLVDDEIPRPSYPECADDPAPCYYARCRHSLLVDVNRFGTIKINFPGWDVDEMPATCSVKEARKGPRTVDQVASMFNLTDEAVRAIERDGWRKVERLIDPRRLWRGKKRSQ